MNTPFPSRNGLHPSFPSVLLWFLCWFKWLCICLSCLLAFSVCLFVSKFPPGSVLVFCKNVHINAFNINFHPNSSLEQSLECPSKNVRPTKQQQHSLSEKLDRECWSDRQTFYGLLVFCLSRALPSLSEWQLLAYITYAHVANASLCFGPCVPIVHTFRVLLNGWKIRLELKLTYIICSDYFYLTAPSFVTL